jgi:uncharacterized protein
MYIWRMFQRNIFLELNNWANNKARKPLILRGARQVGKTTVVHQFGENFDDFISLNLEKMAHRTFFETYTTVDELLKQIFFAYNKLYSSKTRTLLFIDEIQEVPQAINILRYLYEDAPELHVIAAGSLLELVLKNDIQIPVGRVENLILHPFSFQEFLMAKGDDAAMQQLTQIPMSAFAHQKMMKYFHEYTLIGGMPEIIKTYFEHQDLKRTAKTFQNLLQGYQDDVKKYAISTTQTQIIRNVLRNAIEQAGQRITLTHFGNSEYNSKDVKAALQLLEDARLLHIVYPLTTTTRPIEWNYKKKPKLHFLDIGIVNYFKGLQKDILLSQDLEQVYKGTLIEQIVGQEMMAYANDILYKPNFWIREKNESSAEIDYVLIAADKIIPIKVKAGATGKLKSLHIFMATANHNMAIRIYGGAIAITTAKAINGKEYYILNLPYFLIASLHQYIAWFKLQIQNK